METILSFQLPQPSQASSPTSYLCTISCSPGSPPHGPGSVESTNTQRVCDALRLDGCLPLTRRGARVFCPRLPQCTCPHGKAQQTGIRVRNPERARVDPKPRAGHRVACFKDKVYPRPAQGVRGHARPPVAQGRALPGHRTLINPPHELPPSCCCLCLTPSLPPCLSHPLPLPFFPS